MFDQILNLITLTIIHVQTNLTIDQRGGGSTIVSTERVSDDKSREQSSMSNWYKLLRERNNETAAIELSEASFAYFLLFSSRVQPVSYQRIGGSYRFDVVSHRSIYVSPITGSQRLLFFQSGGSAILINESRCIN